MIEFGKITGEVDNNLLQVKMRTGESLFAPMAVMGTDVTVPSEKWVLRNKDNFLALVAYEKDMYISPMIIGFYPVSGAKSEEYNTVEKLIEAVKSLIDILNNAKVNTQLGPQKFMPDTLLKLEDLTESINTFQQDINAIDL